MLFVTFIIRFVKLINKQDEIYFKIYFVVIKVNTYFSNWLFIRKNFNVQIYLKHIFKAILLKLVIVYQNII